MIPKEDGFYKYYDVDDDKITIVKFRISTCFYVGGDILFFGHDSCYSAVDSIKEGSFFIKPIKPIKLKLDKPIMICNKGGQCGLGRDKCCKVGPHEQDRGCDTGLCAVLGEYVHCVPHIEPIVNQKRIIRIKK